MSNGLLIDWLTLRFPMDGGLSESVRTKLADAMGRVLCIDSDGELKWQKGVLDIDALRSDAQGVFWQVQLDGTREWLVIGGSPASAEFGCNVFGHLHIRRAAEMLIRRAAQELGCILPRVDLWQCRRIDITGNYALPDAASVKTALRQLMHSDSARRKAGNHRRGGDSVYWSPTSDIKRGKAYHKGPHLEKLVREGKLNIPVEWLELSQRLLRLEMSLCSRWFRRNASSGGNWLNWTTEDLTGLHREFFAPLVDGVEVSDMNRTEIQKRIEEANGITEGRAKAAFRTLRGIEEEGFEVTREGMARRTFFLHLKYLRAAGFSDADLHRTKLASNVIPMRRVRVVLAEPVASWDELRRAA